MLSLTKQAIEKIVSEAGRLNIKPIIRIGVSGGGCSGFVHKLFYITEHQISEKKGDIVVQIGDITVVVDGKSNKLLEKTVVGYSNKLMGSKFVYANKDYIKTCGCGKSFKI